MGLRAHLLVYGRCLRHCEHCESLLQLADSRVDILKLEARHGSLRGACRLHNGSTVGLEARGRWHVNRGRRDCGWHKACCLRVRGRRLSGISSWRRRRGYLERTLRDARTRRMLCWRCVLLTRRRRRRQVQVRSACVCSGWRRWCRRQSGALFVTGAGVDATGWDGCALLLGSFADLNVPPLSVLDLFRQVFGQLTKLLADLE
mmetsp:Transcript_32671/g.85860  ORF Transcript_32671/g.85860 Transcript_32671/m.85860 type:complete len:203 (+) Transcript_32671:789-1397(+)